MATNDKHLVNFSESSVDGIDEREAHPKHWVAALVQVRSEKAVGRKLQSLDIENYVPTQWEIHQWSDRKKKVERVVIPMIVFIRAEKADIKRLILHPFIHKLLTYPGQNTPTIIPDAQIENLKFMLRQSEAQVEMMDRIFKTGDRFATRCYGKVLINAKTGMEACLIEYRYSRILLEAPKFARLSSPDVHKDNAPLHANAA